MGEPHPPGTLRTAVGLHAVPKNGCGWAAPSWGCAPGPVDKGPAPAPAPAPPIDTRVVLDDRCSVCPGGDDSDADGDDICGIGDSGDLDCETESDVRAGGDDGLSSAKPVPRAVMGGKLGKEGEEESMIDVSWAKEDDRDMPCGDSAARGGGL